MSDIENPEVPMPRASRLVDSREARKARTPAGAGVFGRTAQFLRDVRAEMRRVSWPTAKNVQNTTIITLVAVIFFAVYLFAVDQLWTFAITRLNQFLNWLFGA